MKKIMCLILVTLCFINTTVCAAKYSDVTEENQYFEAVELLNEANIMLGYDGKFRPDDIITRAEVVAIANRLQGLSEAAKAATSISIYTDVAKTDWFAGDVNLASQMGVIAGDGNGLFRPNDQVRYDEAIKIMVTTLGYSYEDALKKGGWPTGYIIIAEENGIIKETESNDIYASRGAVAQMASEVYKILSIKTEEKVLDSKENTETQPAVYDEIDGITVKNMYLVVDGEKTQGIFKYDNDTYTLNLRATLNFHKNEKDRNAIVKLVVTNAYDRNYIIENEFNITIPKDTDEYIIGYEIIFNKTEWLDMLYKDLLDAKDSDILFMLYVNDDKVNEIKETFSYQYSAEKSVVNSFEITDVQLSTLNGNGDVVQKGDQIVKYANVAKLKFDSKVKVDATSSEEQNVDIFHVYVAMYEDYKYDQKTEKISGRMLSYYRCAYCPIFGENFWFTYGGEYRLSTFRTGKYTMVFMLHGKIIYEHDFTVVNP